MMRRRGFTLIELMVTTALLGGILIVLGIILSGSYQQTAFLTGRGAMTGSVTNALETITSYALLGADMPATYTYSSTTYTRSPSTLIMAIPSLDAQGATIPSSSDTVIFNYVSATGECTLFIYPANGSNRSQTQRVIVNVLSNATFTYGLTQGQKQVTVTLTGKQDSHGNTITFPITQTTYLLNQAL